MTVVLLHAYPLDETMWDGQREVLAGRETFTPNLYRLGSSMDGWAAAVLTQTEGELVLVGASMGGGAAVAAARQAPERVRAIMLAGAHAGPDAPERRAFREQEIARLQAEDPEKIPAQVALRDRPDDRAVVASFPGPLWVVVGDSDELLPVQAARELSSSALRGRLVVIEGAGHLVSVDKPHQFNPVLSGFLEECA